MFNDALLGEPPTAGFAIDERHAELNQRMIQAVVCFSLLAFGIPGFAPDEHLFRYATERLEPS